MPAIRTRRRHTDTAPLRQKEKKVGSLRWIPGGWACREHHLGNCCGNIVSEVSGRWRGGLVARLAAVRGGGLLSKGTAASVGSCVTISTHMPTMKRAGVCSVLQTPQRVSVAAFACLWPLLHAFIPYTEGVIITTQGAGAAFSFGGGRFEGKGQCGGEGSCVWARGCGRGGTFIAPQDPGRRLCGISPTVRASRRRRQSRRGRVEPKLCETRKRGFRLFTAAGSLQTAARKTVVVIPRSGMAVG